MYPFADFPHGFLQRLFAGKAFVSRGDFAAAFFQVPRTYNHPDRYAEQVGVGEHDSGAHVPVVINHFDPLLQKLIVKPISTFAHLWVIRTYGAQMHLPGRDGYGPDGSVFIVMRFAYRGRKPSHTDAVTALSLIHI